MPPSHLPSQLTRRTTGLSPSVQDENTYTPLHAAASWGHIDILRYLVGKGGDINIRDGDDETPLFVVESAEMARVVIELGGDATLRNAEGVTVRLHSVQSFAVLPN